MKYFETPVGDFLQNLVGPFYSDARRINVWVSLLVAATSALTLGWIIHTVAAAINKDRIRKLPVTVGVTSVVIAIVAGTALVTLQEPARRLSQDSRSGRLVSERDQRAYDWLAQQPKAYDGHVFVNPDEGNGWMYAYNRLPSTSIWTRPDRAPPQARTSTESWSAWALITCSLAHPIFGARTCNHRMMSC